MAEMSFPKEKQQRQVKQHERNWLELPSDVTANILYRVGVVEILENVQKVCTAWRKICKDPSMWRVIHMKNIPGPVARMQGMCKHAVDRSQGQLVDINIVDLDRDYELLQYVADRSSRLKRLEIVGHYHFISWNWSRALKKFSMLEELNLYKVKISKQAIEIAGLCCPMLKTLKVNHKTCKYWHGGNSEIRNRTAKAIGENLPELRHLELIANNMTNIGLKAILDGCRHLELLDLRQCLYVDLKGDLGKRCLEKITCIKLPEDTLEACLDIYGSDCATCVKLKFIYADVPAGGMDFAYWTGLNTL